MDFISLYIVPFILTIYKIIHYTLVLYILPFCVILNYSIYNELPNLIELILSFIMISYDSLLVYAFYNLQQYFMYMLFAPSLILLSIAFYISLKN